MIQLHVNYTNHAALQSFAESLESHFETEGELIFQNKRNTLKRFQVKDIGTVVVKRYTARNIFQTIYYSCTHTSKAQKAFRNSSALIEAGVDTPFPYAYVETRSNGWLGHCYFISGLTTDQPIEPLLSNEDPKELCLQLAHLLYQMHSHGIVHHDMNRTNILYHQEDGIHLSVIDTNRCQVDSKLSIDDIADDFVRLTDRLDIVSTMAYEYARLAGKEANEFAMEILIHKINHNKRAFCCLRHLK